ncbi:MAG: PAS domain S-box protein [Pirellulales bacterium]
MSPEEHASSFQYEQFRLLVDSVVDYAIFLLDPRGMITSWNHGAQRLKGYSKDEILGEHFRLFYSEQDRNSNVPEKALEEARLLGRLEVEGYRYRKDGTRFWASVIITAIYNDSKHLQGFVKITRDLTERKAIEDSLRQSRDLLETHVEQRTRELSIANERLRASESRCRTLIDALSVVFWTWNDKLLTLDSTPPWHEYVGLDERRCQQWGWLHAIHTDDFRRVQQELPILLQGKQPFSIEFRVWDRDHQMKTLAMKGVPIQDASGNSLEWTGVCMDLTTQRNLEEQVRQSQKLDAIGRLAGGIAHDFNNLLTVISGYSDLLHNDWNGSDSPHFRYITSIRDAAGRAARLTKQLLEFSRQSLPNFQVLDLNAQIAQSEEILRRLAGEDVDFSTILRSDIGSVRIDPDQLNQILLNLVVNARDAMPRGGKLTIETDTIHLDQDYINTHLSIRAGNYVLLAISDNGTGMSSDVRSRVFEPFFTTKPKGKGTGLGLAVVHGIVQQSQGQIAAYSEPGIGTTIKIYLPSLSTENHRSTRESLTSSEDVSGTERILLVEDELGVREFTALSLTSFGYQVWQAANGAAALHLLRSLPQKMDLIISDVVMPELNGRELADQLRTIQPEIPVLFLSGYTDDTIVRHGILEAEVNFLQKPFTAYQLARKVRSILNH